MLRRTLFVLAAWAVVAPGAASAQSWVDSTVPEKSFDFGTVARGSKLKHSFRVVNTTNRDIHIAATRPKCGCTDVKVGAHDIPPGTQTVIEATLDTTKFVGYKPSGLTLVIDRPVFVEIDLNLTCFIRGDILVNPGAADFVVVSRGGSPTIALNLTYAGGQPDWDISKIHTISDNVTAQLRKLGGSPGNVQYQLTATLKPSTPAGYFKDEITLITNDSSNPTIPILVAADVRPAVTVFPTILNLGQIKAGSSVTKNLVVRSAKPFKVTKVESKKGEITPAPDSDEAKVQHLVKVTL